MTHRSPTSEDSFDHLLDFAEDRDIGSREHQEDFGQFELMDAPATPCRDLVYALADGMGGLAGGEIASRVAVRVFLRSLREAPKELPVPEAMLYAMQQADQALGRRKQCEPPELASMGCTLSCVRVQGKKLYFLSVGDSRIYLIRDNRLYQLNTIHNHREDMRRKAEEEGLNWEELSRSPQIISQGSRITSYICGAGVNQVDCPSQPIELQIGDTILVSSDGLLSLPLKEVVQTLRTDSIADKTAARDVSRLLDRVIDRKARHQDNVSVGLIRLISPSNLLTTSTSTYSS